MFHIGTKLFHIGTNMFHIGTLTIYIHMVHIRTKLINSRIFNILNTYQDGKDKTSAVHGEASSTRNDRER